MRKTFTFYIAATALGLLLLSPRVQADNYCVMLTFDCPSQADFIGYAVANVPSYDDAFIWWPQGGPDQAACLEIDRKIEHVGCVDIVVNNCSQGDEDICGHHPFDFHQTFNDTCEFKNKVHWNAWDNREYMAAYVRYACE